MDPEGRVEVREVTPRLATKPKAAEVSAALGPVPLRTALVPVPGSGAPRGVLVVMHVNSASGV
jgi:hypothetical protein